MLYNNGLHEDGDAAGGLYGNVFASSDKIGTYTVTITVTGTSSLGNDFEHKTSLSFIITARGIDFDGDLMDTAIDTNGSCFYKILQFKIPVNVLDPSDYLLTATMEDTTGDRMKLLATGSVGLPPGPNSLVLEITTEEIVTHGIDLPYHLTNINGEMAPGLPTASPFQQIDEFREKSCALRFTQGKA